MFTNHHLLIREREMTGEMATAISEEEARAKVEIWKYIFGFTEMSLVKCAIDLKIPEVLDNREDPVTLDELSSILGCSKPALYRIMRFLVHRGIFKQEVVHEKDSIGYVQTPLSRLINQMAALVLFETSPIMLAPWLRLSDRVLAHEPSAFEAAHGKDVWEFAKADPMHSKLINEAMACDARVAVAAVVQQARDVFEGVSSVVDVGGGDGTALRLIVEACPWVRGINFDLPRVVDVAPKCNGVEHVAGDFFVHIPKADAAYFMWVLHDWEDEDCIKILKNYRDAISKDKGKVIIVEAIIGGKEENKYENVGLMLDMVMMAHTEKGKERTLKEWEFLLHESGFSRYTVKHIEAVQSVIEAYP